MSIEERLEEMGVTLPEAAAPLANYVPFAQEGKIVFIAGQVPRDEDGNLAYIGKVGKDLSTEAGYDAARLCALHCLAQLKAAAGSLEKVRRILRVGGFVNCTEDFGEQPQVINGASDLIVEVMGEAGKHARAAVGCSALPGGVAVEVDMIAALK